jgi:hypothetical protein
MVGFGAFALAFGAGNQWSRTFAPSNAVIVQSLGTPATRVATTGVPVPGGSHFGAVTAVAPVVVVGVDDDFDADDEQAASAATNRLVPNRPSLCCTLFPPGVCGESRPRVPDGRTRPPT